MATTNLALSNTDAIFEQFPFLDQLIPRTPWTKVSVKRMTVELLSHSIKPYRVDVSDSEALLPRYEWHQLKDTRLLSEDGCVLARVGFAKTTEPSLMRSGWWFKWTTIETELPVDETLGETCKRIGELARMVRFVLIQHHQPHNSNWYADEYTLYKIPKGFVSLIDWLESVSSEHRAWVQKEINTIDTTA